MELQTPLCRTLGIEHPVFSAGVGGGARAELVAAVSGAGGFGVLGASGMRPADVAREVVRTRALTERPFGINVIVADDPSADATEDRRFFVEQIRAAAAHSAAAVASSGETPSPTSGSHTRPESRC